MALKIHRCLWSGQYPENSMAAILECYQAKVARAEIDIGMLRDGDFLVTHADDDLAHETTGSGPVNGTTRDEARTLHLVRDGQATVHRPPLLSEVAEAIRAEPFPTVLELDMKDVRPWPWERVEELARIVEPIRDRVVFGGCSDWNLRRLLRVDPRVRVGFDPQFYLDWTEREEDQERLPGVRGAYGYLDAHPLAWERHGSVEDYLRDRWGSILRGVPSLSEAHVRLDLFERMLDDGFEDAADFLHEFVPLLDVWTLDAGTPRWAERLKRALDAGVDMVTSNTPHEMAAAWPIPFTARH